jgi:hypothetical protein
VVVIGGVVVVVVLGAVVVVGSLVVVGADVTAETAVAGGASAAVVVPAVAAAAITNSAPAPSTDFRILILAMTISRCVDLPVAPYADKDARTCDRLYISASGAVDLFDDFSQPSHRDFSASLLVFAPCVAQLTTTAVGTSSVSWLSGSP